MASGHPPLVLEYAVAENGVIGRNGDLPWRISSDLKRFKARTMGSPVIMGRRTFESIGRPLPGRRNIVVTRSDELSAEGFDVVTSLDAAIDLAARTPDAAQITVIGGAAIYRQLLDRADRLVVTEVHGTPDGDTTMPPVDRTLWQRVGETHHPAAPGDDYATTVAIYERR